MNRTFKQLTAEQRYQIAAFLSKQFNQSQIAAYIGENESCVSRKITRNKMYSGKYDAKKPISMLCSGIRLSKSINTLLPQYNFSRLYFAARISPEQISCCLMLEGCTKVSHET